MISPLDLKIACRNLLRNRRRTVLSGLTLLSGFVLLSLSEATSVGTYSSIIETFTREHTGHVQIHRKGYLDRPDLNLAIKDPVAVAKLLSGIPGISSFTPRVLGPALAFANNKTAPAEVRGIDLDREPLTTRIRDKISRGRFPTAVKDPEGRSEALIGAGLAEILKLAPGDELVLISQGADGSVANDRFVVAGVTGSPEAADSADRLSAYLPIAAAQEFFSLDGRVQEFAMVFDSYRQAQDRAALINQRLERGELAKDDLVAEPWQQVEAEFYKGMQVDRKGSAITYAIVLFIVSIGVLNVILMTILERTREFGVLKAVGMRPGQIFRLIVLETAVLAVSSVLAGLLIAIPLNYWFHIHGFTLSSPIDMGGIKIHKMVAELSFATLAGPGGMVILAALLVCLLPAVRAARIRVVNALRST